MVDRYARNVVRNALSGFMQGRILSKAFDATISYYALSDYAFSDATDQSVGAISEVLYSLYDDLRDALIDVTEEIRQALLRTLVFLQTDLDYSYAYAETDLPGKWETVRSYWPFASEEEWLNHRHLRPLCLPEYDRALVPERKSSIRVLAEMSRYSLRPS